MSDKKDILSLDFDELKEYVKNELEEKAFRADQIARWMSLGKSFEEMTDLPEKLRIKLTERAVLHYPKVRAKYVSQIDGTVKFLFEFSDGECVEGVVMDYEHGKSMCISTQAGCRMGCKFCASTIGGKKRDLRASEILGEIIVATRECGERISGIVLMGIGEPFDNYDNVIKFLKLVNSPKSLGIGYRHISLSTCGIVPGIYKLADEDMPITLSISLHAHNNETRNEIMPINKRYDINELLKACVDWFDKTGRRISFEYTLICGKNDSSADAEALASLLKGYFGKRPFHVNLIPVNPVTESGFSRGSSSSVKKFAARLNELSVNATVRRTLGADISASCGQLRLNSASD